MGVVLAGWNGDVPRELDGLWHRVTEGPPETDYATTTSVLVLGPAAADEAVRTEVIEALDQFGGSVLQVRAAGGSTTRRLPGATEVGRSEVHRYVQRAQNAIPLQRMPLVGWLDSAAHDRASAHELDVLRLLPRLHHMDAEWWRRMAELSRSRFESLTRRVLHLSPGAAIKCYRLASANWLRTHDHSLSAIATTTGYSSKQTLSRALRTVSCVGTCKTADGMG